MSFFQLRLKLYTSSHRQITYSHLPSNTHCRYSFNQTVVSCKCKQTAGLSMYLLCILKFEWNSITAMRHAVPPGWHHHFSAQHPSRNRLPALAWKAPVVATTGKFHVGRLKAHQNSNQVSKLKRIHSTNVSKLSFWSLDNSQAHALDAPESSLRWFMFLYANVISIFPGVSKAKVQSA